MPGQVVHKARRARNLYFKKGSWWFAKQIGGKREWVNLRTADEAAAVELRGKIEHNPLLRPAGTLDEDIDAFIAYKRSHRRYSPNSGGTKVLILRQFAKWLPTGARLQTVTAAQCKAFYLEQIDRVAESTAHGYMMTLRSFFRWSVEVRRVRLDNPVAAVGLKTPEHIARKKFLPKQEANRLIAEATVDDQMRFILFCGFHAGLRRDEISEARRYWFDVKGKAVKVHRAVGDERLRKGEREWRPKYNKERTVPLTAPFQKFLKKFLAGLDPLDFVLQPTIPHGRWRYRYDIRRPFSEFMAAHGQAGVTPHVMRHSFASNLKIAGKSIAKIADWLGDTERVTERNYAHLRPDDRDVQALA